MFQTVKPIELQFQHVRQSTISQADQTDGLFTEKKRDENKELSEGVKHKYETFLPGYVRIFT